MTLLVAVTDDDVRPHVMGTAVQLGRAFETDLYVVHLTSDSHATVETRNLADELRDELVGRGVEFTVATEYVDRPGRRSGTAVGTQLGDITTDEGIDHVVVGHETKSTVERLLGGDTAFTAAETANVPVTIVPPATDAAISSRDSHW